MALVMGMDQHRAQISAEWIDTVTGEISTTRIAPADRAAVRRFLTRFDASELEIGESMVALKRPTFDANAGFSLTHLGHFDLVLAQARLLANKRWKKRGRTR